MRAFYLVQQGLLYLNKVRALRHAVFYKLVPRALLSYISTWEFLKILCSSPARVLANSRMLI